MKKITTEIAAKLINGTNGKLFGVSFVKTDGSHRELTGRIGVRSHLKGGRQTFDPADLGMLTVFDFQKLADRTVNLDKVYRLTLEGQTYQVV